MQEVINTSLLFTQLVLHSYAVISLAFDLRNYCCIFAQIACNKLCNKFVQWCDMFTSLFRQCFSWDPAQYLLTAFPGQWRRLLPSSCLASIACSTEAVESWGVGERGEGEGGREGGERVWKETDSIFYFVQRCTRNWHTVITEEQKQWRNITNSTCSCSQAPPQLCSHFLYIQ